MEARIWRRERVLRFNADARFKLTAVCIYICKGNCHYWLPKGAMFGHIIANPTADHPSSSNLDIWKVVKQICQGKLLDKRWRVLMQDLRPKREREYYDDSGGRYVPKSHNRAVPSKTFKNPWK